MSKILIKIGQISFKKNGQMCFHDQCTLKMANFSQIGHQIANLANLVIPTQWKKLLQFGLITKHTWRCEIRALTNATSKIPRTVPKNP